MFELRKRQNFRSPGRSNVGRFAPGSRRTRDRVRANAAPSRAASEASERRRGKVGSAAGQPQGHRSVKTFFFAPARGLSPLVRPLLLEAILKLLGSRLGALWGLFWAPWGLLGALLGRQGASWAVLGPSWAILGAYRAVLGPSWAVLGPSWASLGVLLGRLGRLLGRPGPVWSHLWALLGAVLGDLGGLWGRLDASKSNKPNLLKMTIFRRECDHFCLMEPFRGTPWTRLEPSGGVFGAHGAVWRTSWAA